MAQSKSTIDYGKVYQGTAAASGGICTFDYPIPTDQGARLEARVLMSAASGGHMNAFGSLWAEYVVENQNGTLSTPAAAQCSFNPINSNTVVATSLGGGAKVQAMDGAFKADPAVGPFSSATWSINGTNARLTVTNQSNTSVTANLTVIINAFIAGST